ncbi:acetyltransferase [Mariprofundus erugo]|uniref:Acetyltransferase n=1 Tax=Mariprofundus erugo TaxID=2528639 RepID=A0A5R9GT12_9PROT|nr:acetyltransferase [Mariprofundus erugo]TLS69050.1 acetyltransferase [Mariprofundus erugo]
MSRLLVLGAGGHGKVLAEAAEASGRWDAIAMLDDRHSLLNGSLRWPVIGSIDDCSVFSSEWSDAIVAVGHSVTRLRWLEMVESLGFAIPVVVHPSAWVSPSAKIAGGTVIMANATVQADARLGRGCIVNTGASVDHDCRLGAGVHICPGVHLGGEVVIGDGSWLGIGCSVIHCRTIGCEVMVAAGATVIDDIEDGMTVAGVPAREIISRRNKS